MFVTILIVKNLKDFRDNSDILVKSEKLPFSACGGDGTVGWVLSEIDNVSWGASGYQYYPRQHHSHFL